MRHRATRVSPVNTGRREQARGSLAVCGAESTVWSERRVAGGRAAADPGKANEAKVIEQPLILVSGATRCRLVEPGTPLPGVWRAVIQPGRTFAGKPLKFYVGSTQVGQVRLPEDWRSEQNAPELELAVTYDLSFVHVKIGVKGTGRDKRFHFPVEPGQ